MAKKKYSKSPPAKDTKWAEAAKKALGSAKGDARKKLLAKMKKQALSKGYAASTVEKWAYSNKTAAKGEALSTSKSRAKPRVALNDLAVKRHLRRLEGALGDDRGFGAAVAELEKDASITVSDLIELAKRFTAMTTRTRPAALKKIQLRHTAIMNSRARSAATAGRVAG